MSKQTKRGNLSDAFRTAAVSDPVGALATQFLAAFGVDLQALIEIASKIIKTKDINAAMMAITAAVQIRANVVFVGRDFGNIREKYPALVIEGDRPQQDIFNFGALHALGHLLCHATTSEWGQKALAKVGSCVTGTGTPDTEAGKINQELAASWSPNDKAAASSWLVTNRGNEFIDNVFNDIDNRRAAFQQKTSPTRPVMAAPAPPAKPMAKE